MHRLQRRIAYIALSIGATLALGSLGFHLLEHYNLFDAFYMTLITISTVGYQEVHPLSHAGRVFNSALIIIGVTVMFFAIGAMTQTVIELELGEYFGKRRNKRM